MDAAAVVSALISTVGAVVFALLMLFWRRVPAGLRRGYRRLTQPTIRWLQTLQSGHVGDYVVWVLVGVAIVGVVYTIVLR